AVGRKLGADGAVGGGDVLLRAVDKVQQDAAALDMAEKARADALALMGALDQAGNVGENEALAAVAAHGDDAEIGMKRRERIVGDLRLGLRDGGEKGRLTGVGQANDAGLG